MVCLSEVFFFSFVVLSVCSCCAICVEVGGEMANSRRFCGRTIELNENVCAVMCACMHDDFLRRLFWCVPYVCMYMFVCMFVRESESSGLYVNMCLAVSLL